VIVRQGFDVIGGARFDINRFTADTVVALQAADAARAAERAAADTTPEATEPRAAVNLVKRNN